MLGNCVLKNLIPEIISGSVDPSEIHDATHARCRPFCRHYTFIERILLPCRILNVWRTWFVAHACTAFSERSNQRVFLSTIIVQWLSCEHVLVSYPKKVDERTLCFRLGKKDINSLGLYVGETQKWERLENERFWKYALITAEHDKVFLSRIWGRWYPALMIHTCTISSVSIFFWYYSRLPHQSVL